MNYIDAIQEARTFKAGDTLMDNHYHVGKVVEVYYNTHRGMLSVRDAKTKKVFAHTRMVCLTRVNFTVQPAGRERVRATHRKNVHAWVKGTVVEPWRGLGYKSYDDWLFNEVRVEGLCTRSVKYNPYKYDGFVTTEEEKGVLHRISKADHAVVYSSGSIYIGGK